MRQIGGPVWDRWTQKGTSLQVFFLLDMWIYFLRPCICITICVWQRQGGRDRERENERERMYVKANLFLRDKRRCEMSCYHRKTGPWGRVWLLPLMKKDKIFFLKQHELKFLCKCHRRRMSLVCLSFIMPLLGDYSTFWKTNKLNSHKKIITLNKQQDRRECIFSLCS